MKAYIETEYDKLIHSAEAMKSLAAKVAEVADMCISALSHGGKIIFCGNGGSASQSQHLAAELVGRYKLNRPAMNALSLTVDTSNLTAIANDYGYDTIYARQLEGVGKSGDVLIGLSTSGDSRNVVLAFEKAAQMGISTIALVGSRGGQMATLADRALAVPADTSAHIQELHLATGHLICDLIEKHFYADAE
ncbi:MAG: SIS domain-containing protein [Akkermansiaceae bacterium]|nr:SIS domain-containing protein [Akkermansiaceae bacterium]